jgi:phenylacetate-CoA ligase
MSTRRFWHEIEGYEWGEVERVQGEQLRTQLDYVQAKSDFYKEKFAGLAGEVERVKSVADLARLPFTTKEEVRQTIAEHPPFGAHVCLPLAEIVRVSSSSGTTGTPAYYTISRRDRVTTNEMHARCFYACGFRPPEDVVVFGYAMGGPFGGLHASDALEYMGVVNVPVGAEQKSAKLLQLMDALQATCFTGITNLPLHLASRCEELTGKRASDLNIRIMALGGEPILPVRDQIEETWNCKAFEKMGMGEFGLIWAECEAQAGMHYLSREQVLVELIDPASEEPMPMSAGAEGEIVYTSLEREGSPLVRYRTGDLVSVVEDKCACGRTGPLIRCVGRTDDMLKVKGVNLYPSAVGEVLAGFRPEITGEFRIVLRHASQKFSENMPLRVELGERTPADDQLQRRLEEKIRSTLTVRSDVELVPHGGLKFQERGGFGRKEVFERAYPAEA